MGAAATTEESELEGVAAALFEGEGAAATTAVGTTGELVVDTAIN